MSIKYDHGLGLTGQYGLGEQDWAETMNENLRIINDLKLSGGDGPIYVFATVPDPATTGLGSYLDSEPAMVGVHISASSPGSGLSGIFEGKPNYLAKFLGDGKYELIEPKPFQIIQYGGSTLQLKYFEPRGGSNNPETGRPYGVWASLSTPMPIQDQADWNESNTGAGSYIKNKPAIFPSIYEIVPDSPSHVRGYSELHRLSQRGVGDKFIDGVIHGARGIEPLRTYKDAYDEVHDLVYRIAGSKILCSGDLVHWKVACSDPLLNSTDFKIFATEGELIVSREHSAEGTSIYKLNTETGGLDSIGFDHGIGNNRLSVFNIVKNVKYFIHVEVFIGSPDFKGVVVSNGATVVDKYASLRYAGMSSSGRLLNIFHYDVVSSRLRLKQVNNNNGQVMDYLLPTLPIVEDHREYRYNDAYLPNSAIGNLLNWGRRLWNISDPANVSEVSIVGLSDGVTANFTMTSVVGGNVFGAVNFRKNGFGYDYICALVVGDGDTVKLLPILKLGDTSNDFRSTYPKHLISHRTQVPSLLNYSYYGSPRLEIIAEITANVSLKPSTAKDIML